MKEKGELRGRLSFTSRPHVKRLRMYTLEPLCKHDISFGLDKHIFFSLMYIIVSFKRNSNNKITIPSLTYRNLPPLPAYRLGGSTEGAKPPQRVHQAPAHSLKRCGHSCFL